MNGPRSAAAVAEPAVATTATASTNYLYWWLLLCLFFEYARPSSFVRVIDVLHLNSLLPMALLLTTIFAKGLRPVNEFFKDGLAKWPFVYFGLIVFSLVHASITTHAFAVVMMVLGYLILWFIIMRVVTTFARIRGIMATLILAHLFLLVMNPDAILNPSERHYIVGGSFLGDGNDFSLSVCILLPMAVELALSARSKLFRIGWWGCLLMLVLAIVASSSRGGTLGMAAVFGYLWLRSPRKGLTLAGVALGVVILLAYAPDLYFQRMNSLSSYQEDSSATSRIGAWKAGTRMALDNPILGVGAGNFAHAYGTKYKPPTAESGKWMNAHSMYFMVLGEMAVPGIVALLMMLFGNMRANTRLRRKLLPATRAGRKSPAGDKKQPIGETDRMLYLLNASMLGFAICGAFLSVAYYPHIFVVGSLMLAARRIVQQQLEAGAAATAEAVEAPPIAPRGRRPGFAARGPGVTRRM